MTVRSAPALTTLLVASLLLFLGDASAAPRRGPVSAQIRLVTYRGAVRKVQTFSLTCNPAKGNLLLAARVCRDLSLHPKAMLDPPHRIPGGKTITCIGGPFMPQLSVSATSNGTTRRFGGSPGCSWPGDQAVSVYFDAAEDNERDLTRAESLLRCDEDPALFTLPTPLASVVACTHGLWTPRSEQLIRLAEKTPALARLNPSRLFPHDIGALPCKAHAGGPRPGRNLGVCGVTMKNVWSTATVSFTEDWTSGSGNSQRHIWHVVIRGMRVIASSQSGPIPKQLRR